jgi:hypothetical protein
MDQPLSDDLRERLAERTHENWAAARRRQGWTHGPERNDARKEHPSLVPYAALSEEERVIDREVSDGVLDGLRDLGLRVTGASVDTFREYEFIAGSTQFLTERRQAAAQTYLAVNTAVIAIVGLLVEKMNLPGSTLGLATLPLLVVGAISCLVWQKALHHYRSLIAWRYRQLIAIEQTDAMLGSRRLYTREWEEYDGRVREKGFPFTTLESSLPKMFFLLYVAFIAGVIAAMSGWKI